MKDKAAKTALFAGAICLFLAALLLFPALLGHEWLGGSEFTASQWPFLEFARRSFSEAGRLPLWLPHLWAGMPFAASMNAAVLYPTEVAAWMAGISAQRFYPWDVLLHVALSGAGTGLLLSREGFPRGGALFGALAYSFGGLALTQMGPASMNFFRASAWLPLLVLALRGAMAGRRKSIAGAALILGALFTACALQMAAFSVLWVLVLEAACRREGLARRLRGFAGAVLLGAAVGAAWLLPAVEYYGRSVRSSAGPGTAAQWALAPAQLLELVWPGFWGRSSATMQTVYFGPFALDDTSLYPGLLPLALAMAGIVFSWRARLAWLVAGGFALLLSFGPVLLPGKILVWFPVLGGFRGYNRWWHFVALVLAFFAAEGWRAFAERARARRMAVVALAGLSVLAVLGWGMRDTVALHAERIHGSAHISGDSGVSPGVFRVTSASLGRSAVVAPVSLAISVFAAAFPAPGLAVAGAAAALDLALFSRPYLEMAGPGIFAIEDAAGDYLKGRPGVFRVHSSEDVISANFRMGREIESVSGYHTVPPRDIFMLAEAGRSAIGPGKSLNLLNVRYRLEMTPDGGFGRLVGRMTGIMGKDVYVYSNPGALGRVFFPGRSRGSGTAQAAFRAMREWGWDWRNAVLTDVCPPAFYARARLDKLTVSVDRRDAVVSADGPALAVFSEKHYPGWRAFVDGERARNREAYGIISAVDVPRGTHTVSLVFDPPIFRLGLLISFMALSAALWLMLPAGGRVEE